jgi:hypothetical protein
VRVRIEAHAQRFVANSHAPDPGPIQEEALLRGKTVDGGRPAFLCQRLLQRRIGDREPAKIPDILTQGEPAVNVLSRQGLIPIELLDDQIGSCLVGRAVRRGPPVLEVSVCVELAAAVIEPVAILSCSD